jgi:uncharacterized membrane protein
MIVFRLFMMVDIAFVLVLEHALPWFHGRRLFGVVVPEQIRYGEAGADIIRRYEIRLLPWTLASLLAAGLLPLPWSAAAAMAISGIAVSRLYTLAYRSARPYGVPDSGIREASLVDPGGDVRGIALRFLPPLMMPGALALWLRAHWESIPPRFPIHWSTQGVPNGWSSKSVAGVYGPLLFAALIVLFLAGLSLAILLGSRRGSPVSAALAAITSVAYFVAALSSLVGILPLHYVPMWVVGSVIAAFFVTIVAILIRAARAAGGPGDMTPDDCWRGGQFYYNPQDPALFVQAPMGSSFTFNFDNRASWFFGGLVVLYIAGMFCLACILWS